MTWWIRKFDEEDRRGIRFLWLKSFAETNYGRRMARWHGTPQAADAALWREHGPIVDRLMVHSHIICDPEDFGTIWAFGCWEPDAVHFGVVKHRFAEWRKEMLEMVLPLDRAMRYTHVIPDVIRAFGREPPGWVFDEYFLARR